jgi:ribonuclease HII
MCALHEAWPAYGFDVHKGYSTPEHSAALDEHGPCPEHRFSYVNVRAAVRQTVPVQHREGNREEATA